MDVLVALCVIALIFIVLTLILTLIFRVGKGRESLMIRAAGVAMLLLVLLCIFCYVLDTV